MKDWYCFPWIEVLNGDCQWRNLRSFPSQVLSNTDPDLHCSIFCVSFFAAGRAATSARELIASQDTWWVIGWWWERMVPHRWPHSRKCSSMSYSRLSWMRRCSQSSLLLSKRAVRRSWMWLSADERLQSDQPKLGSRYKWKPGRSLSTALLLQETKSWWTVWREPESEHSWESLWPIKPLCCSIRRDRLQR